MSVVIIVIKLDIQIICSLFFFQLHSSRHYCGSHISSTRYDNRALLLESGLSMTLGVLPWHEDDNRLPLELSLHSPVRENEDK